jgi:hypothetical protein
MNGFDAMRALVLAAAALTMVQGTQAAEVPMQDCSGFPCIEVRADGIAPLRMAIDTGDANSLLDLAQAKALGLSVEPTPVTDSSGKPIPGYFLATLKNVRVGQEPLGDVKFLAVDLSKDIGAGHFPRANGSIAYTDLKGKLLTLDYKRHVVGVADATAVACPATCGAITYPTFGHRGPPIVVTTGFRMNDKDVSVQVDTLYAGTMLIYPTSVDKLGLKSEAASTHVDNFPYTDGGVDMIRGQAAAESFGTKTLLANAPLYFATPKVHAPDGMFDGTVGAALFAGHVVSLDFRANRFWME